MTSYSRSQLSDDALLHQLKDSISRDRTNTAVLLADLAEVEARKLYLTAGYPSMYTYCVEELRLCEQAALKRIRAARVAREFPVIFAMVADGRLHLSGVILLKPYLTEERAEELLAAAARRSTSEIERLLAERFPSSEALPMVYALPHSPGSQLSPRTVGPPAEGQIAPGPLPPHCPPCKVSPTATERFELSVTFGRSTHEKLCYAQSLLSHQIPNGHLAEVLDRVLDLAIGQLEKQKFAATDRPRQARGSSNPRTIPAHVQRAVWERDRGQCTFESEKGHRCSSRDKLEFDHIDPVARGGQAAADDIRLRCRAHN